MLLILELCEVVEHPVEDVLLQASIILQQFLFCSEDDDLFSVHYTSVALRVGQGQELNWTPAFDYCHRHTAELA